MEEKNKLKYEELSSWGISGSLYHLMEPHNFNENVKKYILHNDKIIYEKYGSIIPTISEDSNILVKRDEMGIYFTCTFPKEVLIAIKEILSNDETKKINNIYFYKEQVLNLDFMNITKKYKNITPQEIGLLALYVNNNEYFEKYLTLLNNCDEDIRKLTLNILEPFSFRLLNNSTLNYRDMYIDFRKYITDDTEENNIELDKNYYEYRLPDSTNVNIYFYKEFEYYFVKLYELFEEIVKKENCINALDKILKFKQYTFENIPVASGDRKKEYIYEWERKWDDDGWYDDGWYEKCVGSKIIDTITFKEKEVLSMKKALTHFLATLLEEEINYKDLIGLEPSEYITELLNILQEESKVKKLCK